MTDAERAADMALIRAAIDASGKSARRFAVEDLIRDERTIRRWVRGDSPIPQQVRDFLAKRLAQGP